MARPLVYVAGSTREVNRVRRVQEQMKKLGYTVTYDWTALIGKVLESGAQGGEVAVREIAACRVADLLVICCPEWSRGLGCWIEMGAGLAAGTPVICIAPPRESIFFSHPAVTVVPDEEAIRDVLNSQFWRGRR